MADAPPQPGFLTAQTLAEALPYIQRYDRQTVVIKYGGHAMGDETRAREFAADVVLLKHVGINPVVVHGGGPQIAKLLEKLDIESRFEGGLRVTDEATMDAVEMVLVGSINKEIVRAINAAGGKAVGLSGADAGLMRAARATRTVKDPDSHLERAIDLGYVGEPDRVDPSVLNVLAKADDDFIPVIAPVAFGADAQSYNVNADTAAGAIAGALKAKRLLLLTDIAGVLDGDKTLIREMGADDARRLIETGVASGGMIPKLETCMTALAAGVEAAVILDGRKPHALLMELFTEHGAGTLVR